MPLNIGWKNPFTTGALFGGAKSSQESSSEAMRHLKGLSPQKAKADRPKVQQGDKGLMLKRTGGKGLLNLGRLEKKPPGQPKVTAPPKATTGGAQTTGPVTGPTTTAPTQVTQPPQPTLAQGVTKLRQEMSEVGKLTAKVETCRSEAAEKGGKSASKTEALISAQHDALGKIEKTLGEVTALISKHGTDPTKQTEVDELRALRKDLMHAALGCEFPALATAHTTKIDVATFLSAMEQARPFYEPDRTANVDLIISQVGRMASEFNSGAKTSSFDNGNTVTLDQFRKELDNFAEAIADAADPEPRIVDGHEVPFDAGGARDGLIQATRDLAARIGTKVVAEEIVDRLTAFHDPKGVDQATATRLGLTGTGVGDNILKSLTDAQTGSIPLGNLLRGLTASLPHMREYATGDDVHKMYAAESLNTLVQLVSEGEIPPALFGHDSALDKSYLSLATAWAERTALAHAEKGLSNGAVLTDAEKETIRKDAKLAAQMRYDYTIANMRLEGLLRSDRSVWYKPSTWGDRPLFFGEGSAGSVSKSKPFLEALIKFGGKDSVRDLALLFARISHLEESTLKSEKNVLGLWPNIDLANHSHSFSGSEPLAHLGISSADLRKMGMSETDLAALSRDLANLGRQGLTSPDQVIEANEKITEVMNTVLRSDLAQQGLTDLAATSVQAQGRILLGAFLIDAWIGATGQTLTIEERTRLTGNIDKLMAVYKEDQTASVPPALPTRYEVLFGGKGTPQQLAAELRSIGVTVEARDMFNTVRERFQNQNKRAESLAEKTEAGSWTLLSETASSYRRYEAEIVGLLGDRGRIEKQVSDARTTLKQQAEALNIDINVENPRGLRSANAILGALDAIEKLKSDPTNQDQINRRDTCLEQLKGFDTQLGRRPWYNKIATAFGRGSVPTEKQLTDLRTFAESIVTIREGGPALIRAVDDQIAETGSKMDQITDARRDLQPAVNQFANQLIRTAILANWPAGGKDFTYTIKGGESSETFDPSSKRAEIESTLRDWGFDVERFAPELDTALYGTLTRDDIDTWKTQAAFSNRGEAFLTDQRVAGGLRDAFNRIRRGEPLQGVKDILLHRSSMPIETQRTLIGLLESFQEGDKLNLKSGQKVTLDSGRVPFEPTGLGYIRGRLAMSGIGQFEIERGSDGYKLHLRTGGEGKINADVGVGMKFGVEKMGQLDASVGAEGSHARTSGYTFSFDTSVEGRNALVAFVAKIVGGENVSPSDWASAKDVAETGEQITKGGANIRAGLKGEFIIGAGQGDGLSVEVGAAAGLGHKSTQIDSLNETTRKGEVEINGSVYASASVYAKIFSATNFVTGQLAKDTGAQDDAIDAFGTSSSGKPNYDISSDLQTQDIFGVSATLTATYTSKWKQVRDGAGFYTKGEIVRQTNVKSGAITGLGACSAKSLTDMIEILDSDDEDTRKQKTARQNDIGALMKLMTADDVVAVTYNVKASAQKRANELLDRAAIARRDGDQRTAAKLEKRADTIMHDESNYTPAKISLVTTHVQKQEVTNLNARFIKWDTYSDGKFEHPAVVLTLT